MNVRLALDSGFIPIVFLVLMYGGCQQPKQSVPQLVASPPKIHLGRLNQNEERSFLIQVSSNGSDLKLHMIASSCGCIAPAEYALGTPITCSPKPFEFTARTTNQVGEINKIVHFEATADSGTKTEINVPISYSVEATPQFVVTTPNAIGFDNEDVYYFDGVFSIMRATEDKTITLDDVIAHSEFGDFVIADISERHIPVGSEEKNFDDRFNLRLISKKTSYRTTKLLLGCDPKRKIEIPVNYADSNSATLDLNSIFGGEINFGDKRRKRLAVKNISRKDVEISGVSYSGDRGVTVHQPLTTKIEPGESIEINLDFEHDGPANRKSGIVTIRFTDARIGNLAANISWIVGE